MVLGGTFLVFAIAGATGSEGAQIREIGLGLTIGVALDTFVVRTLIVPSVVVLLGRWNWWPASLHHRHVVLEARRHRRAGKPAGLAREPITLAGERRTLAGEPVTPAGKPVGLAGESPGG
jgi:uncharacterized membrane protein YdfJ with MMPL/SSD domain